MITKKDSATQIVRDVYDDARARGITGYIDGKKLLELLANNGKAVERWPELKGWDPEATILSDMKMSYIVSFASQILRRDRNNVCPDRIKKPAPVKTPKFAKKQLVEKPLPGLIQKTAAAEMVATLSEFLAVIDQHIKDGDKKTVQVKMLGFVASKL